MTTDQPYRDTRGPAVVIYGTLGQGITTVHGPFDTVADASDWAAQKERDTCGTVGPCTVKILLDLNGGVRNAN